MVPQYLYPIDKLHQNVGLKQHAPWSATPLESTRGEVVWEHRIHKNGPWSNIAGAAGGVTGTILAGLVNMAAVHCTTTTLRSNEAMLGTVSSHNVCSKPKLN